MTVYQVPTAKGLSVSCGRVNYYEKPSVTEMRTCMTAPGLERMGVQVTLTDVKGSFT